MGLTIAVIPGAALRRWKANRRPVQQVNAVHRRAPHLLQKCTSFLYKGWFGLGSRLYGPMDRVCIQLKSNKVIHARICRPCFCTCGAAINFGSGRHQKSLNSSNRFILKCLHPVVPTHFSSLVDPSVQKWRTSGRQRLEYISGIKRPHISCWNVNMELLFFRNMGSDFVKFDTICFFGVD